MHRRALFPLVATLLVAAVLVAACGPTAPSVVPSGGPAASVAASAGVPVDASSSGPDASTPAASTPAATAPAASTPAPATTEPPATPPVGETGTIPPDATVATPAPPGPATPAPSQSAACAKLNDAIYTIDLHLQLLTNVDRTSWADLTAPGSPTGFDRKQLTAAIAALARVPGTSDAVASLREIDRVLAIALSIRDPFGPGIRTGPRLVQLAQDGFVPIETALVAARTSSGCPG